MSSRSETLLSASTTMKRKRSRTTFLSTPQRFASALQTLLIIAKAVGEIRVPRGLLGLVGIFEGVRVEGPVLRGIGFKSHRTGRPVGAQFSLAFGAGTGLARGALERIIKGGATVTPLRRLRLADSCFLMKRTCSGREN